MGVISEARAAALGVSTTHPGWSAIHGELVEYAQRVLDGLKTPPGALGRGLGLDETTVAELKAGRSGGLTVDELLGVFETLELPVTVRLEQGQLVVNLSAPARTLG
jgi:hypothetical protein